MIGLRDGGRDMLLNWKIENLKAPNQILKI